MSASEFGRSTLREVSIWKKGALWRRQQDARAAMLAAYNTAGWVAARMAGVRVPPWSDIAAELDSGSARPPEPRSPDAVWNDAMNWAISRPGVRIEQHAAPVI